jgi:DNA gyrase/topoisomerase IV subunit B
MIKNEIKILSDKEHIIKRSGMYIGSSANEEHERFVFGQFQKIKYVPGLVKIIDEIIDNSIDEAIRTNFQFANKIDVTVSPHLVSVSDNGRGIPQSTVTTPEGEQIPGPVAAWTRPKAGGNFGDDSERKTGGMNGVGSSLTNIFSTVFTGIT